LTKLPEGATGWLCESFAAGAEIHEFASDAALDGRVRHVADWIAASVFNDEAWLKDLDDRGRPKKLLKIGSLAQAEAEADKAMRRFAFKAAAAQYVEVEGEETVMTFANGNRIVRLLSPAALDRESAMMGHCVGQGAYDATVADRSRSIYSLRDGRGQAHVTFDIEERQRALLQCKGKGNLPPVGRYLPEIRAFVERERVELREAAGFTGLVEDTAGRIHSVGALPKGLSVPGSLDLREMRSVTALPEDLKVAGHLDLRGTAVTALPESLLVRGYLDASRTAITALPKGLKKIGGHLDISDTAVTDLPEGLKVGGDLKLRRSVVKALPRGLEVGRDLDLADTAISKLPKHLYVRGNLFLSWSAVSTLPKGLRVGGDLDLRGSAVTALPEGLTVGGNLHLRGTGIKRLPEDLKVGAFLFSDDGTQIVVKSPSLRQRLRGFLGL